MSGRHVWKSCVEEPDIYIGENYSNEHQMTKKYTKDFLHPGILQEARQRLHSVFINCTLKKILNKNQNDRVYTVPLIFNICV